MTCEPEPVSPSAARPDHNYVAAVCRNLLRDLGRDPAAHDRLIYAFAAGWNGSADRGLIREWFGRRLAEARP